MTWVIIIVLAVIVFFVISSQRDNKKVEEHFLKQGGLRKSYPILVNHLENYHKMEFSNDTGRYFSYSKNINEEDIDLGLLIIGVKLEMNNNTNLFSKFVNYNDIEFEGIDVTGVNFNDVKSINKCIDTSTQKFKSELTIYDEKKCQRWKKSGEV